MIELNWIIINGEKLMGRIETKIKQTLKIQDENERKLKIDAMITKMIEELKGKNWNEKARILNSLDLDYENKLKFFIFCFFDRQNLQLSMELVPMIINGLINNNLDKFIELIQDNEEMQKMYAMYLKGLPSEIKNNHENNLEFLLKLPEVKKIVLGDNEFIKNKFSKDFKFFESLPKEYGYLISLYDTRDDKDSVIIKMLYNKFFGNALNEEEQGELIKIQQEDNQSDNVLKLSIQERTKELEFCLEQIQLDERFFMKIKNFSERAGLNFRDSISFFSKYYNIETLDNINEINDDMAKKIQYLASEKKIQNAETLTHFEQYSLDYTLDELDEIASNENISDFNETSIIIIEEDDKDEKIDEFREEKKEINKDGQEGWKLNYEW